MRTRDTELNRKCMTINNIGCSVQQLCCTCRCHLKCNGKTAKVNYDCFVCWSSGKKIASHTLSQRVSIKMIREKMLDEDVTSDTSTPQRQILSLLISKRKWSGLFVMKVNWKKSFRFTCVRNMLAARRFLLRFVNK